MLLEIKVVLGMAIEIFLLQWGEAIKLASLIFFLLFFSWLEARGAWLAVLVMDKHRWFNHLSLGGISKLLSKIIFSQTTVYMAWLVDHDGIGLLHKQPLPMLVKVVIGMLFLDFVLYWLHRLMHQSNWLWRIHQVHHLDNEIDASTGLRFHPFESLIIFAIKMMAIIFLGVPVLSVLIFEVLFLAQLIFTHARILLPSHWEVRLQQFWVTPKMHQIHHTIEESDQGHNFGFCLCIWDRMFKTYRARSLMLDHKMVFGLVSVRGKLTQSVIYLLLHPFGLKRYKQRQSKPIKLKMRGFEP